VVVSGVVEEAAAAGLGLAVCPFAVEALVVMFVLLKAVQPPVLTTWNPSMLLVAVFGSWVRVRVPLLGVDVLCWSLLGERLMSRGEWEFLLYLRSGVVVLRSPSLASDYTSAATQQQ
jgi:hypothetical protein